ncbi:MAG: DUF5693 family protein [Vulcanimicrobiota bacterium]
MLGGLAALGLLARRQALEARNHSVEMVADLAAAVDLARARHVSLPEMLAEFSRLGIGSVAVNELHLDDLIDSGQVLAMRGLDLRLAIANGAVEAPPGFEPNPTYSYVVFFGQPQLAHAIANYLKPLIADEVKLYGDSLLETALDLRTLRGEGLGFPPSSLEPVEAAGLRVWLRPENRAAITAPQVEALFDHFAQVKNVEGVIFGGGLNEALGYPDALDSTAAQLRQRGWKVGYIELSAAQQQKGIETLVRQLPDLTVRLLAVSPAHQAKLDPYRVAAMYSLGGRERNIRLLYLRPYPEPGGEADNKELFQLLGQEFPPQRQASTFEVPEPPPLMLILLVALAAGAGTWLLLGALLELPDWVGWVLLAAAPLATMACQAIHFGQLWRTLMALGMGCVFPLLGVVANLELLEDVSRRQELGGRLKGCTALLWRTSLVSLAGALLAASLLYEPTFWLGLDRFRGVKLLTLGVPLLAALVVLVGKGRRARLRALLDSPLKVWHLLAMGGGAVLGVLYLLRTGNDSAGTATESERVLRVVLDQLLGVRPRFKEFLLAHPAMVLTPALGWLGMRDFLALGVMLGAVGQVGMIDTFAHIHTPLVVSLVRSLLGLVLGWLLGLIGVVVITRWQKR